MRGPWVDDATWESEERGMVARFVQPGMRALELGAGRGIVTTALMGARCAAVWAVEPLLHLHRDAPLAALLWLPGVRVWGCAADVRDGTGWLDENSEWWCSGMDGEQRYGEVVRKVRVPVVDTWRLAADLGADVVLMDIEGTERRILAPEQGPRIPATVRLIIVERHDDALPALLPGWRLAAVDDLVETWER